MTLSDLISSNYLAFVLPLFIIFFAFIGALVIIYKDRNIQKSAKSAITEFKYTELFQMPIFLLIVFSTVSIVVIVFTEFWEGDQLPSTIEQWGAVGDYFGGMLNPVLAFASFMALLHTIQIQSKQLDVSTKELEATRKELTASKEAQQESSKALELQTFERTFFSQIDYIIKLQEQFQQDKMSVISTFSALITNRINPVPIRKAVTGAVISTSQARMYYSAILNLINYTSEQASEPIYATRLSTYYSLITNLMDDDDCYILSVAGPVTSMNRTSLDKYFEICASYGLFRNANINNQGNEYYINIRGGHKDLEVEVTQLGYHFFAFQPVHVTVVKG